MAPGISEAVDVLQDTKEKGGLEVPKLSRPTMERRTSAFVELLDEETNLQVLLVSLRLYCVWIEGIAS